jgi:hypothetical protein
MALRLSLRAAAAAAVGVGTLVMASTSGAAAADPVSGCSSTVGVIVAVDFSPWGGDIERGCDTSLTTGYAALHVAGFTTAGDDQDGPSFICRIDDEPPPSQEPCITTPTASAYWSYWHADAGQDTWTYSQEGAMGYKPPPGSVDAWVFGATTMSGSGGSPRFSPAQVRSATTGRQTAQNSGSRATSKVVNVATAPAQKRPSPGSPLRFGLGAAAVGVLCGAAGLISWRRRRPGGAR